MSEAERRTQIALAASLKDVEKALNRLDKQQGWMSGAMPYAKWLETRESVATAARIIRRRQSEILLGTRNSVALFDNDPATGTKLS